MNWERTIAGGQRCDAFPDRDTQREIQRVPQDWIALRAWRVRKGGFLPFPDENEDERTE